MSINNRNCNIDDQLDDYIPIYLKIKIIIFV